jgi:metal-sulfur cluster biosynthetic enzyme
MDANLENSNPTILNPSDLPSRRAESNIKQRVDGGTGLFDSIQPVLSYPYTEFSSSGSDYSDDGSVEDIDAQEIYGTCAQTAGSADVSDLISTISDPEHPLSLGSLAVVNLPDIHVIPPSRPSSKISTVLVELTPTVNHCSLATVIGLGVRVRLEQALPPRFRVDVRLKEGTHSTADAVNKQLGDKERVAAALENATLLGVIRRMLVTCE